MHLFLSLCCVSETYTDMRTPYSVHMPLMDMLRVYACVCATGGEQRARKIIRAMPMYITPQSIGQIGVLRYRPLSAADKLEIYGFFR